MWIDTNKPHMWDMASRLRLDVGLIPLNGTSTPCGENREDLSTCFPQDHPFSHPIHILERLAHLAHIWGYGFLSLILQNETCPQCEALIHR